MNNNFDFSLEPGKDLNKISYLNYKRVISIITPTFNANKETMQTAKSILNQTYPYFEWIIVDDGSTSKSSLKLLDEIEAMDNRIKVYHKKNEGIGIARDYGVKKSSEETKFVFFIDDDDLIDNTFLETAYFSMIANPEATWCYSDVVNFDYFNLLWAKHFSTKTMKKENLLVNAAMIKKDDFNSVEGYGLSGVGFYEDWILWLKLLSKGNIPIHMSYYGFWYRKKQKSNFSLANDNIKENMKTIRKYARKVTKNVIPIEFPRIIDKDFNYEISKDLVMPNFRTKAKRNVLIILPWLADHNDSLDKIRKLSRDSSSINVIGLRPSDYESRQQYEKYANGIFDLSTFIDVQDWIPFIKYLVTTRNIDTIVNYDNGLGEIIVNYINAEDKKKEKECKEKFEKFFTDNKNSLNNVCKEYRNSARDNDPQSLALRIRRFPKNFKNRLAEKLWTYPKYRNFILKLKGNKKDIS